MLVRRYTYSDSGEEKTVSEFTLPVLYDNAGLMFSDTTQLSKLNYKAIIDGNLDIKHTDKVVVNNNEYNIKSLNLVQYEGTNYIYKLEAEP
jgi:hypothetical protein